MSTKDSIRDIFPPPYWLTTAWSGAKRRRLERLSLEEINAEIEAERRATG